MGHVLKIRAYILISTLAGTSKEVAQTLSKVEGIISAESIHGRFDVVAYAETDENTFNNVVYKAVGEIPEILRSETCILHLKSQMVF